jgi:16S rRNA (uracil1498-N3)-methyltransferase
MHRFFIKEDIASGETLILKGQDAAHIGVLRIRPDETILVCDTRGQDLICHLNRWDGKEAELKILRSEPSRGEPSVRCEVYAAFPKSDKAESIIQKSVELGAAAVYFFPSERCVSKVDASSATKKLERWAKISEEAAKQSGRGVIPETRILGSFDSAVKQAAAAELPLFFYEEEQSRSVREPLLQKGPYVKTVSVMTGSEGGFAPREAEEAKAAGLLSVSLGTRILRCETAPIAALSAVMLCTGNL